MAPDLYGCQALTGYSKEALGAGQFRRQRQAWDLGPGAGGTRVEGRGKEREREKEFR
jgi:hypothetical protein